ncbi:uncharacterized protein LOC121639643 isoform X7 [Melanotaenia boesemani]|uniref:uncharacterized protein LOC121639643 isoform X7 n=1 Tax=Melanotaenia boesemani TaxID=1250792 RepID=UPI001C0436D6|nr:uncharacterized protein LOC121639643 isoform X7 [Melanotaenia boesemani]
MDWKLIVFVLTGALLSVAFAQTRQYYFVNMQLNWTSAQSVCRHDFTDVATIENTDDINAVVSTTSTFTGKAWMGLHDDLVNSWRWSLNDSSFYGEGETTFRNWDSGGPDNFGGTQYCVSLGANGKWDDMNCSEQHNFVCYNGTVNGTPSLVFNQTLLLNWTEAQQFCKQNYVDLVSIRNQTENNIIKDIAGGSTVWIGLYRYKEWSDGSNSLFQYWANGQPDSGSQQCVAAGFGDSGKWSDEDCSQSLPFICYTPTANFRLSGKSQTSITLQWNKVNNNISFVLSVNGTEININPPVGPVTYTVSSLTPGATYTFTLFSVFENIRSSGLQLTEELPPSCVQLGCPSGLDCITCNGTDQCVDPCQNYTSLNDDWRSVNNTYISYYYWDYYYINWQGWYRLFLNQNSAQIPERCIEANRCGAYYPMWIRGPHPTQSDGIVSRTVCATVGSTCCYFTPQTIQVKLCSDYYVYKLQRPSSSYMAYCAEQMFRPAAQNETSITLQWNKVNNNVSFVLQFNGTETNITAPDGNGTVTHTVSSLTAGTKYTFTLFYVSDNVRYNRVQLTAVTAPQNAANFTLSGKSQTSITLQWNKVNNNISFVLSVNGTETNINPPVGPVTYTVSFLTAGTTYTFTLFSVFENIRSSGLQLTEKLPPSCVQLGCPSGQDCITFNGIDQCVDPCQNYTSLNDDWRSVNNTYVSYYYWDYYYINWQGWYRLFLNQNSAQIPERCIEANRCGAYYPMWITGPHPTQSDGIVNRTVCATVGSTCCYFTPHTIQVKLCSGYYVYKLQRPSSYYTAYCAEQMFRPAAQNETSITLQWNKVNNNVSFVLQFNGTETNITAPDGNGTVTHTVSSLTAGTKYTFTLFYVSDNVRYNRVKLTAVTAPLNAANFTLSGKSQTSITLQWNKDNNNISFVLNVNGTETNINPPVGPVTYTVSFLTAGTTYTFTLFSVFENIRSSGLQLTEELPPSCVQLGCPSGQDCITFNGIQQCVDPCQNYTSLNDDWRSVNNTYVSNYYWDSYYINWQGWYRLFLNQNSAQIPERCIEANRCGTYYPMWITGPHPTQSDGVVSRTVCATVGSTCCYFTPHTIQVKLCSDYYVYKLQRPSYYGTAYCAEKMFRPAAQNETSITLQWNKVNNNVSFVLQFNGTETNITAPDGNGTVTHTVSSLTAGTKYTFTLFYVSDNVRYSRVKLTAVTAPLNAANFTLSGKSQTSITLQWNKVNNNISFVLSVNGTEININPPVGPVTYTVSFLTAGTTYTFTLFSVFENIRSSGLQLTEELPPTCVQLGCPSGQDCITFNGIQQCVDPCQNYTSLNDDWRSVNNTYVSNYYWDSYYINWQGWYRLFLNQNSAQIPERCIEANRCGTYYPMWITGPHPTQSDYVVNRTVCATVGSTCCYFTPQTIQVKLCSDYYVYKLQRPSYYGTAYCAELMFRPAAQNETSITLQWNKVNNNVSFVLQFNGTETNITAPDGNGTVTHTVSSLTAGTKYTFTLFYVFDNVRYSRVKLTAVTAPLNAANFTSSGKNPNSITLQWNKVNNNISFVLSVNGTETNINPPVGPVTYTVSFLTAGTTYTFTLFSVFENIRSSGLQLTEELPPSCVQLGCPSGLDCITFNGIDQCVDPCQNYTSLNDDWRSVNNTYVSYYYWDYYYINWQGWYRLFLNQNSAQIPERCIEANRCGAYYPMWITGPHPTQSDGIVNRTVCATVGSTCCYFTPQTIQVKLCSDYYVYKLKRPSSYYTAYCAEQIFRPAAQNETSITLQWNKVNNNVSFVLQFNGTETNITAPDGNGTVTHTVSSLTAGTKYTFTLFYVSDNVRYSRVQLTAVTAPLNAANFTLSGKSQTSITLQWNKVNNNISFVLSVNGTEININPPVGPVTYTVSFLTAGTTYTFTLFSVFENIRSSGLQLTEELPPTCVQLGCPSGQDCITFNGIQQCVDPCQNYTSLNDDWRSVNNTYVSNYYWDSYYINWQGWYRLFLNQNSAQIPERCIEANRCGTYYPMWITAPHPTQSDYVVNRTVCATVGSTCCYFTPQTIQVKLCSDYYVYKLQRPSYYGTAYCAEQMFRPAAQNETSITLQWNKVNNNVSFVLQFNGTETNITAPDGNGTVTHTVSSLTAGTKYTFTLFYVSDNVRYNRVQLTAVTAPLNAANFTLSGKSQTSITLQWNKVNNNISFVLSVNGTEININPPVGPVTYTVSFLTAGTTYTFTLFSVFENIRSSGLQLTEELPPSCVQLGCPSGLDCITFNGIDQCVDPCQNYTSLNDDWRSVNNTYVSYYYWDYYYINWQGWYRLFLNQNSAQIPERCIEANRCGAYYPMWITGPHPTQSDGIVNRTVCATVGSTCCYFTPHTIQVKLCSDYYVYKLKRPSSYYTAYCAEQIFRPAAQNETSITLQWNKVNNNVSFVLQFNGTETNITAPDGNGTVTHTVSSLTAGTKYTFTLFYVSDNVRYSRVQLTAVTAPLNAANFTLSGKSQTSITLQWNKVNNNISFVLSVNGTEININPPVGPVTYTVSFLTAGTTYTFTLFSVFENIRSSGLQLTEELPPTCVQLGCPSGQDCITFNGIQQCVDPCQNYTSLNDDWRSVNNTYVSNYYWDSYYINWQGWYRLFLNQNSAQIPERCIEANRCGTYYPMWITAPHPTQSDYVVNRTVCATVGSTCCYFTPQTIQVKLCSDYYVYKLQRPSYYGTAYCAEQMFRPAAQNETSITLQWNKVNNNVSFVLQFNGTETNITAPDGNGTVTHTVSSLTAGTKYTFTLFYVSDNVRYSRVKLTAVTAPLNAANFTLSGKSQTSITLQWNKVNNNISFVLSVNGTEININPPVGPVTYTVSFLTAGTTYTFTLFSVFENIRSSGLQLTEELPPTCVQLGCPSGQDCITFNGIQQCVDPCQNYTSLNDDWRSVNNTYVSNYYWDSYYINWQGWYRLFLNQNSAQIPERCIEANRCGTYYPMWITGPHPTQSDYVVNRTVCATVGSTCCYFTPQTIQVKLCSDYYVYKLQRPSYYGTAYCAEQIFRPAAQNETSITLQWNKVNNNVSFVLQFNGTETNITAPDGNGTVTHTVSSLTAGTKYTFTLFYVSDNVRYSRVQLTAVTAPLNAANFTLSGKSQTSITLQWNKVNNNISFVLSVNGTEININPPVGPVTYTVSFLTAGTTYTFTLFSVFENIRSSGLQLTEELPPTCVQLGCPSGQDCITFNGIQQCVDPCQNYTSLNDDWRSVNNTYVSNYYWDSYYINWQGWYRLFLNQNSAQIPERCIEANRCGTYYPMWITAPHPTQSDYVVNRTVCATVGSTCCYFTPQTIQVKLCSDYYVYKLQRPSYYGTAYCAEQMFRPAAQNETSITLQWNKVNNNISFVLSVNGTEINISPPVGPVTYTVSFLTAGTTYTFTLFSVFENIRSSGLQLTEELPPTCVQLGCPSGQDCITFNGIQQCVDPCQNYTSLNDDWRSVNNTYVSNYYWDSYYINWQGWYRLFLNQNSAQIPERCIEANRCGTYYPMWITGPHPTQSDYVVSRTVCATVGSTCCYFTPQTIQVKLCSDYYVYKLQRPSYYGTAYCAELMFRPAAQNETSITLQWNKVNNNVSFVLQFNGTETNITAPDGNGTVTHTVSSLTAGTKYTFTLFYVSDNVRYSRVKLTAVTAPLNAANFTSSGKNPNSITLQWNKVNNNISFVLSVNGTETNINPPVGPVTYTVSFLTAGTTYTFTLFSVFENIRSSGLQLTEELPPSCVQLGCPSGLDCITFNGIDQCVDPCQNYTSLNDDWRSVNNTYVSNYYWDYYYINWQGWYRLFLNQNSAQIPERCIEANRCGAYYPMWITAPHPTQSDGIENRTVCATVGSTCCYFPPHTIQVKLCSDYYVYKLKRPSSYYTAYCAEQIFRPAAQNETSITLQWNKVNNNVSFVLQFNGTETNITAPDGNGTVTHTVSSLTAGTKYTFTLFYVSDNVRYSRVQLTAVTAPLNAFGFRPSGQDETSITLQWSKINNNVSFVLQFNGLERSITAPDGDGPVTYTVSFLTAWTEYTFTLFSVFENIRSSGVIITASTAPPNAANFRSLGQNETSITLQWSKVNNNVSFVLQFNGIETNITAPDGDGPVNYTVSSLTARTWYTFTLFSVIENIRSSGVSITAATGPNLVVGLQVKLQSFTKLSDSDLQDMLAQLFNYYGIQPQISIKVLSVKP